MMIYIWFYDMIAAPGGSAKGKNKAAAFKYREVGPGLKLKE
jgi:hypothetical protein